jgi:cytochrome c553
MLPKPELTEDEVSAIYTYLRQIPKIRQPVEPLLEKPSTSEKPGPRLYSQYGCGGCHGRSGEGAPGIPDLRHVNEHFATDAQLRAWIENPQQSRPETKMPTWKGIIKNEDYAPLMDHLRSLGSNAKAVALSRRATLE